ncbi:MAG TPA: hypothetical protein VHG72_14120 [Polyangia bacterium]|nr:hypothetical protein [Polyangia bacterium]
MSAPDIAALLAAPSSDDLEALMLAYLTVAANPVTDFESGAVQRTMLKIEVAILSSLVGPGTSPAVQSALAGLLANGYPDTAAGDSLATLAHGWFEVDKDPGSFAVQTITLACDSSHGPYSFNAGLNEALASDGAAYVASGTGTLTTGSTLTVDFTARSVGLAKALITSLRVPLAGVTVQSAAIKIVGGVPQFGSDPDTDTAVKAAISDRFPDPAAIPTQDRVIGWALAAGTTTTRCRLDPDPALAGGAILTVAGASGPVPSGDVTTVGTYVLARQPITDNITVSNASAATVTPGGTVTVPAAAEAAVQVAADAAWALYLSNSQIGADVYLLQLIKAVMDAGATNFLNPTLNGAGEDLALTSNQVPVSAGTLTALLTWEAAT